MIIAMIVISALVLAACLYVAYRQLRHRNTPPQLRGDWWASFERDFRAYARSAAIQRQQQKQQHQQRPPRRHSAGGTSDAAP